MIEIILILLSIVVFVGTIVYLNQPPRLPRAYKLTEEEQEARRKWEAEREEINKALHDAQAEIFLGKLKYAGEAPYRNGFYSYLDKRKETMTPAEVARLKIERIDKR